MKTTIGSALLICFSLGAFATETTSSREVQKGFFSVGGFYSYAGDRLLNNDGSMSDFKTSGYGLDIDILLWNAGTGDIRLFGSHEDLTGSNNSLTSNKLSSSDTVAGLKVFAGSNLYLAGGWGRGQVKLTSAAGPDLKLSYEMVRAALGMEFPVTESFFIGIEAAYKDAPIRKDRNEGISQNTFIEGFGGSIRFIWSPPSVTINYSSKK